jgi:anti-sigma factor RsiW
MQEPVDDMLLCAYVDGELDAIAGREIETLAALNPAVREQIEMFRASGDLLRQALSEAPFAEVPLGLQRAAGRKMFQTELPSRSWSILAAVATLLLGLGLGSALTRFIEHGSVLPKSAIAGIMHDIAEYHPVYAREVEHLVEVPASQHEHLEQWLGERVGLALKAPDLSAYGLRFQGGRLIALHDHALAQLMYTGPGDQRVALCVAKLQGKQPESTESLVDGGLKLHGVSKGGHVFVVVGPAGDPLVDRLSADLPALLTAS